MFPSIPGDTPPSDEETLESCGIQDGDVIKMYRIPMPFPMYGINEPFKIGVSHHHHHCHWHRHQLASMLLLTAYVLTRECLCPGIRPILGNVFLLEVRRSDTFGAVKQRIEDKIGYLVHTQDFRFGEDEDEKTLDHFRIIEPMTLTFQLKRRLGKADTKLFGARDEGFTDAGDSDGDDGRLAVEAVSDERDGVGDT